MKPLDAQFWLKVSKLTEAHERGDIGTFELRDRIRDVGKTYGLEHTDLVARGILEPSDEDKQKAVPPGSRKGARRQ